MKRVCVLGSQSFIGKNMLRGETTWEGTSREELNLLCRDDVDMFFENNTYDSVLHCCVRGGSRLHTDRGDVTHDNILMFENVVRHLGRSFPQLLYFSSGAALRGDPPTDPYGLSKWIIDKRIQHLEGAHSLRIWGCYGPDELPTRFSAVCAREGHVNIEKDRYFDFIDVRDVKKVVHEYVEGSRDDKEYNLVYPEKMLLSQWATRFGATFEITQPHTMGENYCCSSPTRSEMRTHP